MSEAFVSSAGLNPQAGLQPADMGRALAAYCPIVCDEFTAPPTKTDNAFLLVKNSLTTTAVTYSAAAGTLDGSVGAAAMITPRNVILTTAGADSNFTGSDAVVITGLDVNGAVISETLTITNAGSPGVFTGAKAFIQVTSIVFPAMGTHTDGTVKVGFGDIVGFRHKLQKRAGRVCVLQENEAASVVTTGTFADAATGLPNGTYLAANAPNGSRNYAVTYERDPSSI